MIEPLKMVFVCESWFFRKRRGKTEIFIESKCEKDSFLMVIHVVNSFFGYLLRTIPSL